MERVWLAMGMLIDRQTPYLMERVWLAMGMLIDRQTPYLMERAMGMLIDHTLWREYGWLWEC